MDKIEKQEFLQLAKNTQKNLKAVNRLLKNETNARRITIIEYFNKCANSINAEFESMVYSIRPDLLYKALSELNNATSVFLKLDINDLYFQGDNAVEDDYFYLLEYDL